MSVISHCVTLTITPVPPAAVPSQDLKAYFKTGECLALVDLSLMVKSGVQYSLWGGSVINLGTEGHRRK